LTDHLAKAWNEGDLAAIDDLLAADFVLNDPPPGVVPNREGYKQFDQMHRTALPDLQVTVDDLIAEGNKVARRLTLRGTHKGAYMGNAPTAGR
jgi:predicted ester cyclase